MKFKFKSDHDLPLGKTFNIVDMIIVVAFVLEKMINIIHKIFYMNAYISYKNVLVQKKKNISEGIGTNKTILSK